MTFGIEFSSGPDALGRRQFTLHWWDGVRRRGQVFWCNPREFVKRERRKGNNVVPLKRLGW